MNRTKRAAGIIFAALFLVACSHNTATDLEEITQVPLTEEVSSSESFSEEDATETMKKENQTEEPQYFYIDLCGAVVRPGVYEVEPDTRLFEAIALAGGLTKEAASNYVNQAALVIDGEQIMIPTVEEAKTFEAKTEITMQGKSVRQKEENGKIDLNQATKEQLCTIPGVGENKADTIIAYRNEHGKFQTIEDIKNVSGIKEGMYGKMKEYITVGR